VFIGGPSLSRPEQSTLIKRPEEQLLGQGRAYDLPLLSLETEAIVERSLLGGGQKRKNYLAEGKLFKGGCGRSEEVEIFAYFFQDFCQKPVSARTSKERS